MLSRNILLGFGVLALLAAVLLSVLWFHQGDSPTGPVAQKALSQAVLVSIRPIPAGTVLRPRDITWDEMPATEVVDADIVRSSAAETEFIGAVTRRAFAASEPLSATALVKPGDREFLVAALRPGYRAVSIGVDAAQSASGLVLPGDRVDVILTQSFSAQGVDAGHRSVGETVLRDLRVIAIDQTLSSPDKPVTLDPALGEPRMPKTVTLEVTEHQAAMLLVAEQLGKVQLALRGELGQDAAPPAAHEEGPPIWASDVSQAFAAPAPVPAGALLGPVEAVPKPVEAAHGSIEVMHGSKIEHRCLTSAGLIACP
jgi:pilus assembly protein CpaB